MGGCLSSQRRRSGRRSTGEVLPPAVVVPINPVYGVVLHDTLVRSPYTDAPPPYDSLPPPPPLGLQPVPLVESAEPVVASAPPASPAVSWAEATTTTDSLSSEQHPEESLSSSSSSEL